MASKVVTFPDGRQVTVTYNGTAGTTAMSADIPVDEGKDSNLTITVKTSKGTTRTAVVKQIGLREEFICSPSNQLYSKNGSSYEEFLVLKK